MNGEQDENGELLSNVHAGTTFAITTYQRLEFLEVLFGA